MDVFAAATTCLGPDRHIRQHGPARVCRAAAYLAVALGLAAAVPAAAHPLGNDSITHFNVLYVLPDRLEVDYLLDLAENPTQFIESGEMDSDKNGQVSREEQENWLGRKVTEYANFLSASIDGEPLSLSLVPEQIDPNTGAKSSTSKIIVPMLGPMGMTYRIVIRYVAHYPDALGPGEHVIRYEDKTYPQHRGLKLVLLEPTPFLCRLYDIPANVLQPGPVPPAIASALADEALGLQEPATARLEPAAQAVDGRSRWRLSDGERQLSLTVREDAIDVSVLPYCEFIAPDVPLVSEDNAAFRYEQYDPVNLPDVRRATVRFTVVGEQRAASRPVLAAGASRPAGDVEPTGVATAAPADPGLPHHASDFLDPNYNPIKRSEYERQAEKMIGLLQGRWSPVVLLLVTALAFGWGAAHALMPGHAKTVVAAYLISQRGTYWHAAVLAVIVTVTHTALVVIMGLVIWYFQESNPRLAPALQLWLGLIAGLLVMSMGLTLLWRAATGRLGAHGHDHDHPHGPDDRRSWWRRLFTHSHPHVPGAEHGHSHHPDHAHAHDHSHDHGHAHPHAHAHDHVHDHGHAHAHAHSHDHGHAHEHEHASSHGHADSHGHVHADDRARPHTHSHGHAHAAASAGPGSVDHLTFRMLLVLGVTGGIVPCPSATIIMFLGIGANVVPGALYAIAVFSLGLALTLMLIGSLALASRRYAAKVLSDARHEHELSGAGRRILLQVVPALSGLAVVTLGGMIAVHYLCLMRGVTSPFPWMG